MGVGQWMRVIETVGGLVQLSGRLRQPPDTDLEPQSGGAPPGGLEARLAGVVVAALQEAFDRDKARMDLERSHLEAERQRAEEALRIELRRQAAERLLGQLRLLAVMAGAVWMLSAALGVWLPHIRSAMPLALMGTGWAAAIGALGCAFSGWQQVSSSPGPAADAPVHPAPRLATAALWLLLGSVALTGAALLAAL